MTGKRMVTFDRRQREIAKREGLGLVCLHVEDNEGGGATYSCPADEKVQAIVKRALVRVAKLRQEQEDSQ